jgi:peptide/nickel transport system permease protein
VLLLLVVTCVTFTLVNATPGNAAYTLLGAHATHQQIVVEERLMGLNKPVYAQYWTWLTRAVQGNLGHSLLTGQATWQALTQRLGPTLSLLIGTIILSALLGTLFGVIGALRGGLLGRVIDLVGLAGIAIPSFVVGIVLIGLLAVKLRWLPASGYVPPSQGAGAWLQSLILPILALSFSVLGILARQVKISLSEVLEREYITAMRGNGYSWRSVIFKHGLRNAALPVIANLGVIVVGLLSGSILVEAVFAYPGLGSLLVISVGNVDLPLIIGVVLVFTIVVIIVNLAVDLVTVLLDPRLVRS